MQISASASWWSLIAELIQPKSASYRILLRPASPAATQPRPALRSLPATSKRSVASAQPVRVRCQCARTVRRGVYQKSFHSVIYPQLLPSYPMYPLRTVTPTKLCCPFVVKPTDCPAYLPRADQRRSFDYGSSWKQVRTNTRLCWETWRPRGIIASLFDLHRSAGWHSERVWRRFDLLQVVLTLWIKC